MNNKNSLALWNKAKKIIPGGSQLLSKRSEMFLPNQWPAYYQKAKGVDVSLFIRSSHERYFSAVSADVQCAIEEKVEFHL